MGYLLGLNEYLKKSYHKSIFDQTSNRLWQLQLHNHRIINARITENLKFDVQAEIETHRLEIIPKINIKFLYTAETADAIIPAIKWDEKIKCLNLEPVLSPSRRNHVKNKSLFPLMKERRVVFFTVLEGEIIRGIITDFSRYEITVHLQGGVPVTILRHAIYDLRDKKGRSFLKSLQEEHRDWEKSDIYVSSQST